MDNSRFITFEGGEGVGKTTLLQNLANVITAEGHNVDCTREPGGTKVSEALRGVLLDPTHADGDISPMTEALILAAARRNHVECRIRPALQAEGFVLCDRFLDSTRAYQGTKLSASDLQSVERLATDGVMPGTTFLLDADPADLIERRRQRGATTDRFERRSLDYHREVRSRFLELAHQEPARIFILDALLDPETILANTLKILRSRVSNFSPEDETRSA